MLGLETEPYLTTPGSEGLPNVPEEALFKFRYLNGDRVEVHHPFHSVTLLGDGTDIATPYLDRAAVVLFQRLPYLLDTRKLSRPDHLATRPLAGRYSELSHCFSLAMIAKEMGGGPVDVLDALYNDAIKLYGAHQGDDNYWGHGKEDGHDQERPDFFRRAGIIEAFIDADVLRPKAGTLYLGDTRLTLETLLSEDEATVRGSFMSNKHIARRMDADRFQYNEEERFLVGIAMNLNRADPLRLPRALAQLSMESVVRRVVVEQGEGDQLIFIDRDAAKLAATDYVRHNSEHWCEPVQDLVSDLLNIVERYLFLCDHPAAESMQLFFPRDYLHTSSTMIHELFAKVAQTDPAMEWFLGTATKLAEHQRGLALSYDVGKNRYEGPKPPEWVKMEKIAPGPHLEPLFSMDGNIFRIVLPKGKVREIDPRVQTGGTTTPLKLLDEDFAKFSRDQHRWIGDYQAEIEIEDNGVAEAVRRAVELINTKWRNVLDTRPPMPNSVLRETIEEANSFVKQRAKLT